MELLLVFLKIKLLALHADTFSFPADRDVGMELPKEKEKTMRWKGCEPCPWQPWPAWALSTRVLNSHLISGTMVAAQSTTTHNSYFGSFWTWTGRTTVSMSWNCCACPLCFCNRPNKSLPEEEIHSWSLQGSRMVQWQREHHLMKPNTQISLKEPLKAHFPEDRFLYNRCWVRLYMPNFASINN